MSGIKRYEFIGDYNDWIESYDTGNYIQYTDYQAAQAKIKELEGSVVTIPYDEMKESMLRLYKQQVPRLNDVIDKQKTRIEKLELANRVMREALELAVARGCSQCSADRISHTTLIQVKEILGE